ncbi:hypothetical protein PQR05_03960 [Paraburkholderia sediminicola]|uniref:hypothetical protein n=1 Tax=Paraburkholderia sediminicola TaxID=458836 RepID=UPI0038B9B3BB
MNLADQQHLAAEAGHLLQTPVVTSASATALDNHSDCAKPQTVVPFITGPYDPATARSGPRIRRAKDATKFRSLTVSTDREPWVHLHAANVRALGPRGAIIFDYVSQWSRASKKGTAQLKVRDCHGGYWLACSYEHIEQQTGLRKYDAEQGITDAVDAGALETTVMEYGGERSLHIRIAPADGAQIVPWPLVVGDVTGEQPKSLCGLKSKVDGPTLLSELSGPANFPLQPPSPSTAIEETLNSDSQALPETLDANQCDQAKATREENSKADSPSTPALNAVEKKFFEILPSTYTPNDWVEMFSATGAAVTAHERGRLVALGTKYERQGKPFAPFLLALLETNAMGTYAQWKKLRAYALEGQKTDKADFSNPKTYNPHVDFFLRRHAALYVAYRQYVLGEGIKKMGWQPPPPTIIAPPAPAKPVDNGPNKFLKAALKNNAEKAQKAA